MPVFTYLIFTYLFNIFSKLFLRDAKQSEAILGQQELYLSRQVEMPTADSVQEEIKKLEEFLKKMDTHDEKINHVMQFADQLRGNGHYAQDKVQYFFVWFF